MKTAKQDVVIITGAASGIGEAISRRLYQHGMAVVLADKDIIKLSHVAKSLDDHEGRILIVPTDVSDERSVENLVASAITKFGHIDYGVNNAGLMGERGKNTDEIESEEWNKILSTDLNGVYFGVKYMIPEIRKSGGGAIVNMSSAAGLVAVPGEAGYVAAKHGIIGLTRAAALEYAGDKIRVNAVCPGFIETPDVLAMPERDKEELKKQHPMGRFGTTDEVAALTEFLLTGEAKFITGGTFTIDGGYTAK